MCMGTHEGYVLQPGKGTRAIRLDAAQMGKSDGLTFYLINIKTIDAS